jgi:hypothetical protein
MKDNFFNIQISMKSILARASLYHPLLILITISLSLQVSAQNSPLTALSEPEEEQTWEQIFVQSNIAITKWFNSVTEGLDLYLVGKRVSTRPSQSSIRIENNTTLTEAPQLINSTGIILIPRLPNLEEYWHLKFATYDEREDSRNAKAKYILQTPQERNYGATVGVFKKLGNIRVAFQPRIELQSPLRVSHSLVFESIADLKTYSVNPKLEFYAKPDQGVGAFQALNFHFQLTKIFSMTLVNQGDYREKLRLYSVTNGISFGQILNPNSAFSHNVFFSSNSSPNYHLESYNLSVSYSQVLYKRILDYQVVPNLDFQKALAYKGASGINIKINLNF